MLKVYAGADLYFVSNDTDRFDGVPLNTISAKENGRRESYRVTSNFHALADM